MELSKRLSAVASMVTEGNRVADVGTDHGYLPIFLIETGKIPAAVAMDINKGPISRAEEHILQHGLSDYIETRLSDGAEKLQKDEADTLIVAGMGGGLVIKIMTEGSEVLKTVKEYILQPQSELFLVRKFLQQNGYKIINENMILEDGKYYPMMKAVKGSMYYDKEIFFKYGKCLLEGKNEVLKIFLEKELQSLKAIYEKLKEQNSESAQNRMQELKSELTEILEALEYYQ